MPKEPIRVAVGPQPPPVSEEAAQAARDVALRVVEGPVEVTLQGRGVPIEAATLRSALRFTPDPPDLRVRLDPRTLYGDIASAYSTREQPARDAGWKLNGARATLVGSRVGRKLDMEAIAASIVSDPDAPSVRARFEVSQPELHHRRGPGAEHHRARVGVLDAVQLLRAARHQHPAGRRDARRHDHQAGLDASPSTTPSGRGPPRTGYVEAPEILAGKLEDAVGGGVSQVVDHAVYNAAFFAGLELDRPHAAPVLDLALPGGPRGHPLVRRHRHGLPQRLGRRRPDRRVRRGQRHHHPPLLLRARPPGRDRDRRAHRLRRAGDQRGGQPRAGAGRARGGAVHSAGPASRSATRARSGRATTSSATRATRGPTRPRTPSSRSGRRRPSPSAGRPARAPPPRSRHPPTAARPPSPRPRRPRPSAAGSPAALPRRPRGGTCVRGRARDDPPRRPRRLLRLGRAARRSPAAGAAGRSSAAASCWRPATRRGRAACARRWAARGRGASARRRSSSRRAGRPTSQASRAVFEVFERTAPLVEGLSIDEAFLDVRGLERIQGTPSRDRAPRCGARCASGSGLPITVGIATTKFLAKVASAAAKPDGPAGGPARRRAGVPRIPCRSSALWGVGPATAGGCARAGIATVGRRRAAAGEERARGDPRPGGGAASSTRWPTTATRGRCARARRRRSVGSQCAIGLRLAPARGASTGRWSRSSTG